MRAALADRGILIRGPSMRGLAEELPGAFRVGPGHEPESPVKTVTGVILSTVTFQPSGILSVTVTSHLFLIDQDDGLLRLPPDKFQSMLAEPAAHPLPQFSGQRIRAANVVVEVVNRVPTSIQEITYYVLTFDQDGWLNVPRFHRQVFGEIEEKLARRMPRKRRARDNQKNVIDAANRFGARGGTWVPSVTLADAIQDAALGRVKTRRL